MPFGRHTKMQRLLLMGTLLPDHQTISLVSCDSFRVVFMCEQYACGLVELNPQMSVHCLFAEALLAKPAWLSKRAATEAVGTLSAGQLLEHLGRNAGVGEVLDGEKGLLHGYTKISFHRYEKVPSLRTRLTMETASLSRRPQNRAPGLRRRR